MHLSIISITILLPLLTQQMPPISRSDTSDPPPNTNTNTQPYKFQNPAIYKYESAVRAIITDHPEDFCKPTRGPSKAWTSITPDAFTPAIATDAWEKTSTFLKLLTGSSDFAAHQPSILHGATFTMRPAPKSIPLIQEQYRRPFATVAEYSTAAWLPNSDLSFIRIGIPQPAAVYDAAGFVIDYLRKNFGPSVCTDKVKYPARTALASRVYFYNWQIGYVTEVQINHAIYSWCADRREYNDQARDVIESNDNGDGVGMWDCWSQAWGTEKVTFFGALEKVMLNPDDEGVKFDVRGALEQILGQGVGLERQFAGLINPYLVQAGLQTV